MRVKIWWESEKNKKSLTKRILWSELLAISKQIAYLFGFAFVLIDVKTGFLSAVFRWAAGFLLKI